MDASPEHRHRCEVRAVLRWRVTDGAEWVRAWLRGVAQARGKTAAQLLHADAAEQWANGNRGQPGDWRE